MNDSLHNEEEIFRLLNVTSSDGTITHDSFTLSSEDKKELEPALSVWAIRLTSPVQARKFIHSVEGYKHFAEFFPREIRELKPQPDNPELKPLDVKWNPLPEAQCKDMEGNSLQGGEGHCGITGFAGSTNIANRKPSFTNLRVQLAEMANTRLKIIL